MRTLVIYDSLYGNTARVAIAIYNAANKLGEARITAANAFKTSDAEHFDMIFIGSPTQGGRPTHAIESIVRNLSLAKLSNVHIAAFDTRFSRYSHSLWLRLLMDVIGFAAPKITRQLNSINSAVIEKGTGFIVKDKAGPLEPGELSRAASWAHSILTQSSRIIRH
jgi:hypothetical protein